MIIAEGESSDDDDKGMSDKPAEGLEDNSAVNRRKKRSNPYDAYDFDGSMMIRLCIMFLHAIISEKLKFGTSAWCLICHSYPRIL